MIAAGLVLAQAKAPPPGLQPPSVWATLVVAAAFVAVLALGVIVISLLGRWRKQAPPTDFDPNEQLAQFQELYEKGELSQEEFDKIRERLRRQICREHELPAAPPADNLKAEQRAKDGAAAVLPPSGPTPEATSNGEVSGPVGDKPC
ncbi:MAG TPA: SHOCT domain-containing protein [Gemmataceae bacterium]|jgi:hypothetical protein|nr:SHOCT domain-containing protein [Gemmataceae bacterium]